MHIKLTDGQPQLYSIGQLRRDNPQVSFPSTIPADTLAEYDVYEVTLTEQPVVDHTQRVTEGTPTLVDGVWTQTWEVTDLSESELAEVTEAQWTRARKDRNRLLADCDWTQLADSPADAAAWALYRQALRDITTQSDPFNLQWPTPPGV
jgi:hypothetical protein